MTFADEYPLWDHQREAVDCLRRLNGCAALFMQQRTGKCRPTLAYLDEVGANRILIVSPKNSFGGWVREYLEVPIHERLRLIMLTNELSIAERSDKLRDWIKTNSSGIVLVNFEAYWRKPLRDVILRWQPEAVVCDEAQRIGHYTAQQSRFAHVLGSRPTTRYKIPLSGTPITKGLQNAFSIYKFFRPEIFGNRYVDFRDRYLVMGGFQNRQIKGYQNLDEAISLIAQTSYRKLRSECFTIPEARTIIVTVPLKESLQPYRDMQKDYLAKLEGKDEAGNPVQGTAMARILLTASLHLSQITRGHCTVDTGGSMDIGSELVTACIEQVQELLEADEKVVIFCRFRRDVARLSEALDKLGIDRDILIGGMADKEREKIIPLGRWAAKSPVLVSQIQAGSVGLNFSEASSAIFYSTGYNLVDFQQARDRLQGSDQKDSVGYYFFLATLDGKHSVDNQIYKVLDSGQDFAGTVMQDPAGSIQRVLG